MGLWLLWAPDAAASGLLAVAVVTDLRGQRIQNAAVGLALAVGLGIALAQRGSWGAAVWATGVAAALPWWAAVAWLRLGPGDAKLAMALGGLLGPRVAIAGPALGYALCALCLLPWIAWRAARQSPWRGVALPMAPWIAAGTALVWVSR